MPARRRRRWLRRVVVGLLLFPLLLLGLAGALLFSYFFTSVPLPSEIGTASTVIVDSAGAEIGTLQPQAGQVEVELADLPQHVVDAVLAAEDAQFYEHRGVSVPGVLRALAVNVLRGEVSQGGSTISQQYVKIVTADTERTPLRKVREAALAIKLERQFSKDEILEFYLNTIYFGRGAYGIEAAAQAYFGKPAAELATDEAALVAGVIPAPSRLDPLDNAEGAERRYRYVIGRLLEEGWIEPAEAERMAQRLPQVVDRQRLSQSQVAPYFVDKVREDLGPILGGEDAIYRGLRVTTTLNLGVQAAAQQAFDAHLRDIEPAAALVALDPATGGVRAMIGGRDHGADELNLATRARREPGSTFKPFTLAAYVESGKSPDSTFDGGPIEIADASEPGGVWAPRNYGDATYGALSLREATERSVNTVYARLSEQVTPQAQVDIAARAGIPREHLQAVTSIALGTQGVTPLELAEAYNTFAAGGVNRDAITVLEVEGEDGRVLYEADTSGHRAFGEQVAWTVTDVLKGVIASGTGTRADIGRPAAGKTGTTSRSADAWFAGYTPQLTGVVWMGNRDDNQPMSGDPTGGGVPAEAWATFMRTALEGVEARDFPSPDGDLDVDDAVPAEEAEPEPEPPLECPEGQVVLVVDEGEVCVEVEPAGNPEPTEEPTAEPTPEPTAPAEPAEPQTPAPAPPPASGPSPAPGQPEAEEPEAPAEG